jgi:hypothetical protein
VQNDELVTLVEASPAVGFKIPAAPKNMVARNTIADADLLALIKAHKVTAKTQHIVNAVRAAGYKTSLGRVNRLMGRFTKVDRKFEAPVAFVPVHDAHVEAYFDAAAKVASAYPAVTDVA